MRSALRLRPLAWAGLVLGGAASGLASEGPLPDYSGTWVLVQKTATVSRLPVLADVVAETTAISVQELRQKGERLEGSGELCSLRIETNSDLVKTELPPAFIRSLPKVRTSALLKRQGEKLHFVQNWQTLTVGAELASSQEALPKSEADPRVRDSDGDGRPGVTIQVRGLVSGEVFVVQRSRSRLLGGLRGEAFVGRIQFSQEQSILGASNSWLKGGPEAEPDETRSYFRLSRLPAGTSCRQLRADGQLAP